jgi:histidyl-tRNA synthetase
MKLENAKGTRDFPAQEKIMRDKILTTLKDTCELYGFNPIETPIIEKYETLAAKFAAGDESDAMKEVFLMSDNGDRKLGLRFDLTVPFSRFIAMNKNMKMPFKKYMTGEVFRDGPIKTGRYRQFTQFDPDIVGSKSMGAEAELLSLLDTAFSKLEFDFSIELSNKKIIEGILLDAKIPEGKWEKAIISIDKLKKIGQKGVLSELVEKGFNEKSMNSVLENLKKGKTNKETLEMLKKVVKSDIGKEGINELDELFDYLDNLGIKSVMFDPSLARGLAYYTGTVFEVFLKNSKIRSSAAAGGRYDKLIGNYLGIKEEIPAVGFAFGVEVLLEALKEKGKVTKKSVTKVFAIPIKTMNESLNIVKELRNAGINTDVDLLGRGISKNLAYANSYEIPYVLFIGQKELESGKLTLRDMKSGKEESLDVTKLANLLTQDDRV